MCVRNGAYSPECDFLSGWVLPLWKVLLGFITCANTFWVCWLVYLSAGLLINHLEEQWVEKESLKCWFVSSFFNIVGRGFVKINSSYLLLQICIRGGSRNQLFKFVNIMRYIFMNFLWIIMILEDCIVSPGFSLRAKQTINAELFLNMCLVNSRYKDTGPPLQNERNGNTGLI